MSKRSCKSENESRSDKRPRVASESFAPPKVATRAAARAVDHTPPLDELVQLMDQNFITHGEVGSSILYWMRMGDLRVSDNRALCEASEEAKKHNVPLIAIFILSPQDYTAHDRSPRRIDFTLRNLEMIKVPSSYFHNHSIVG
jgi:deoxyribodipyrimidine photo-lyase